MYSTYDRSTLYTVTTNLKEISEIYDIQTYIVGGAVRDIISLFPPRDIDVASTGNLRNIALILADRLKGTAEKAKAPFELWKIKSGSLSIDLVALHGTPKEDYKQRNFSINSIYYNVRTDEFEDPTSNGFRDLHNHVIRANSNDVFLRNNNEIFIALRLVAEHGFSVDANTLRVLTNNIKTLGTSIEISKRGASEIQRAKASPYYNKALALSKYIGLGNLFAMVDYKPASWESDEEERFITAKYKSKKITPKGNVVYEYGEKDKKKRAEKKARQVRTVFKNINKVKAAFTRDMASQDKHTQMTALAVALIYHTYERVGDRSNIGAGITSLKKKHVTTSGSNITLKYVGKSHVRHEKHVKDATIAKLLRELMRDKGPNGYLFDYARHDQKVDISAKDVNAYLSPFGITAKDLRAHAANDLLIAELKKVPKPPSGSTDAEKTKFYKKTLKEAIEYVAEQVGHTPGICKSSYIDPKLIESYENGGKVVKLSMFVPVLCLFKNAATAEEIMNVNPDDPDIQAKIMDPSFVEIDPLLPQKAKDSIENYLKKMANPPFLGVYGIVARPSGDPSDPSAYGFVRSDKKYIVYLDPNKLEGDVKAQNISEELKEGEVLDQLAALIFHEITHTRGGGEPEAERAQEEAYKSMKKMREGQAQESIIVTASQSPQEDNVFSKLNIPVANNSVIDASRKVVDVLKLGEGSDRTKNAGLLALGYLISVGENPYRAEWYVRRDLNIKENINFIAARDLYTILSKHVSGVGSHKEENEKPRYSLFADPSDAAANLGETVSPRWEAEPSAVPDEWKPFFPSNIPNY